MKQFYKQRQCNTYEINFFKGKTASSIGDAEKLKQLQIGDVHRNARLHPYFTLMCNSTAYHIQTYSFIGSETILIVVELHVKVKHGCRRVYARWTSLTCFSPFSASLYLSLVFKWFF